ncbi:hypothetical protein ACQ4PT_001125 [Festuca glaucescens]
MVKKAKGAAAGAAAASKKTAARASSATTTTKKGTATPPPSTVAPERKSGGWTKSTFKPKDLQTLRESGLVSASDDNVKFLGDEMFGLQVLSTFLKRRVQPLQARAHPMWMYSGVSDPTRVMEEKLSSKELKACIVSLTKLKGANPLPGDPPVAPFGGSKKLPEDHEVLEKLPPLPESYKKSEDTEKKQKLGDDESEGSGDFSSLTSDRRGEPKNDATAEPHKSTPLVPAAKKQRMISDWRQAATVISSDSSEKAEEEEEDDQFLFEKMLALQGKAKKPIERATDSTGAKGQNNAPSAHDAGKLKEIPLSTAQSPLLASTEEHIEELKKKVEALEKGAQIAVNRALTEAQEREEEHLAEAASREEGLATRPRTLTEKISSAIEIPLDSDEQAQADSLANDVATAEGCGVQVEALVSKLKGGLQRLYANVSSKKKLKERSFGELVGFLCAEKDPLLGYNSDQRRTGCNVPENIPK